MESKNRNSDSGPDDHNEWDEVVRPNQRPVVSQRTYWIRRTVALLILIVFIVLVVIGVKALAKALSGGEDKPRSSSSENAEPAPDASATGSSEDGSEEDDGADAIANDADKDDKEVKPTTDASGPEACDVTKLEMTVAAPNTQFSSAKTNQFSVITQYSGEEPCTIDAGLGVRPVTVFSGEDRIWSSADCDETGARVLVLANGVQDTTQLDWDMRRSDTTCSPDLPKAKPGTYRAVVTLGKAESEPYVFNVVD